MKDDKPLYLIIKDLSGGMNNRVYGVNIGDNQATELKNVDIGVPSETRKRPGETLTEDLGNDAGTGCFGFEPDGGTNVLVVTHGQKLEHSANPETTVFAEDKANFTTNLQTTIFKAGESGEGDVFLVGNGTDNWFRFEPDDYGSPQDLGSTAGTGSDSPPKSQVGTYYRNRAWILKSNLLHFSDAYPSDYSTAFDTVSGAFRIPVGTERAVIGLRDTGLVVMGQDQIWGLNPSVTPDPTTDKPEKLLEIGCVAGKTAVSVGDDILFFASDGVRGLFRTKEDKLQVGASFPLSYGLKDEFESISWAYISKACAVYFDNKYFIALPVDGEAYNNEVWVYYPATQGWMVISGWNVGAWATLTVQGEKKLFYIDSDDGSVYRAWTGYDDEGSAIDYDDISRKIDMGEPLIYKVGGELRITAEESGGYDLAVYASADDVAWVSLGTMNLKSATAPTLPATLPFTLADTTLKTESFHLDSLGRWSQLRIRIRHNATNGSDEIKIYERVIVTFPEEYESE